MLHVNSSDSAFWDCSSSEFPWFME